MRQEMLLEIENDLDIPGDEANGEPGRERKRRESKADRLVKLALSEWDLFHDKDGRPYGTIQRDGHRETYLLRSKGFRAALAGAYWQKYQEGVGGQILQDAIGVLEGHALHGGECREVFVRLAGHKGSIYIDLGGERHDVVRVTPDGWEVLAWQDSVRFRRPPGMSRLPHPVRGGSVDALRRYVNLKNADDFILLVAFLLGCLSPRGPYPVLCLTGEQGSAKTTTMRMLKALVDDGVAACRSMPDSVRDLAIAANNSWFLAYDNISAISGPMSDALCRMSTGGGFATRTLFSDDEETVFDSMRPVVMNGITNVVRRHDLADRSIVLDLAPIPEERRLPEKDLWADFQDDAPGILGALLDAASAALRRLPTMKMDAYPRMADFAAWVAAGEEALGWAPGTFMAAYAVNRREVTSMTLDADFVGAAVRAFMEGREYWEGTPTELLDHLEGLADERVKRAKEWPRAPHVLTGRLRRSATALRADGIDVIEWRTERARFIRLEYRAERSVRERQD